MIGGDGLVARARALAEQAGITRPGRVTVVAVSGGPDSVCLLDVLARVVARPASSLIVLHVDHRFRPESAEDARFVRALAEARGLRFALKSVDGPRFAAERRLGVEHAGRILRYAAFADTARRYRAAAVATGHTQDDSVESVLMHVIRGSGADGLRGIAPTEPLINLVEAGSATIRPSVHVVRPLLAVRRSETAEYCQYRGLRSLADPMNLDASYLRNRVRAHLLPILRTYNPAFDATVVRMTAIMRDDVAVLERLTARAARRVLSVQPGQVTFDMAGFRRQPRGVQRRLIRHAIKALGRDRDVATFDVPERVIHFLTAETAGRLQLPSGLVLSRSKATSYLRGGED